MNTGVAAHISAASPGGPRFDASLSPDDRKSAGNGIWLCQRCGKLVDNDADRYSTETLREWKRRAEEIALADLEGRPPNTGLISDLIQVSFDEWNIWRERGNFPDDPVFVITIWASNAVRYSFNLRLRNMSQCEEQLHKLRMQLRRGDEVLFEDWYSIQYELTLPERKWVTRKIAYGFNPAEFAVFAQADSL